MGGCTAQVIDDLVRQRVLGRAVGESLKEKLESKAHNEHQPAKLECLKQKLKTKTQDDCICCGATGKLLARECPLCDGNRRFIDDDAAESACGKTIEGAVLEKTTEKFAEAVVDVQDEDDASPRSCGGTVLVRLTSFGYMSQKGQPLADRIFSARHILNPHGGPKTHLSGLDTRLRKEVMKCDGAASLLSEVRDEVLRLAEAGGAGRQVSVAVGCEWGKHRSVSICEELAKELKQMKTLHGCKLKVAVCHREQDTWAGQPRRYQKSGERGHRQSRERAIRDDDEIAADNELST